MMASAELKRAVDAAYQSAQAGLQDILRQEADLRRAFSDLEEKRMAVRALPADQLLAPRAIGADLLWQGWTQRMRQELNVKLSQTLVRKAERMTALRLAFGRAEAVNTLIAQEKAARRKAALGRDAEQDQYLAMVQGATSGCERNR